MKFDRQLGPATETSRVVLYNGKTIPRWRTAAILKIDISSYLSEKSSDFHEILYTAADFELRERHVIKNEKVALDILRVRQNVFLVYHTIIIIINIIIIIIEPTSTKPVDMNIETKLNVNGCNGVSFCGHCVPKGDRTAPLQKYYWSRDSISASDVWELSSIVHSSVRSVSET